MKLVKWMADQKGSAVALAGLALAGLLAMTGLVIDLGSVYVSKTALQKAANAAALSGAQELTRSEADVRLIVDEVLTRHGESESLQSVTPELERKVTVQLSRRVPLLFSGLFGVEDTAVEVYATAELARMGSALGVAPLGIDEAIPLEFGKSYTLKVEETDSIYGNFGVLALGGTGSNTYEQNLKYGYQSRIKVGDILDTQTGNIAGKTKTGIQERIDSCPYPVDETYHRDCKRVMLVPVYKPYQVDVNQIKQVQVTGFAYFYILEPMDFHDKTIKGMFIKRAGTGIFEPEAGDFGAYAIRLTE